jgi:hypothetical protein
LLIDDGKLLISFIVANEINNQKSTIRNQKRLSLWITFFSLGLYKDLIAVNLYLIIADKVMKYNQTTLDKIERILDEAQYVVRYERGNFQSGYCILEERKVVVLNKFLQLEGRINTLVDIIPQLKITPELLTPEAAKTYSDVLAKYAAEESGN